jgi:hypothetical protein
MSRTRRQERPTALHRSKTTSVLASLRRRRGRGETLVRTGDGSGPLHPLGPTDPAVERAIAAAERLISASARRNGG